MNTPIKIKQIALLLGDVLLLYGSLWLTLVIRYQQLPDTLVWARHAMTFTIVFAVWIVSYYIVDLYHFRSLKNSFEFNRKWGVMLLINSALALAIFYFLPTEVDFAPKTNLVLFAAIFGVMGFIWRRTFNASLRHGIPENNLLLIGSGLVADALAQHIRHNPQLGYALAYWMKEGFEDPHCNDLNDLIKRHHITTIVMPTRAKKNARAINIIYHTLALGIEVVDLTSLYSSILQKVPLDELDEAWFLENIARRQHVYNILKRPLEITVAVILGVIFFIPMLLIALIIKITSLGPIIITQQRVGRHERLFILYKFRSMYANAERDGPRWSGTNDERVTIFGKFLRFTHLDELPQLINIFRGEVSFVGPRPERPEFVAQLKSSIPYYELRHLMPPGITGWAQIHYRYGSSTEDAYEKLQYDFYYLKNYSFWLDVSILIKTVRLFFMNN